ncbi:uncharacterized protein LOC143028033 [Oratosquilla oratoria]|uniref:uncharacterized protein LOC143028033 n=1 Tax=Oratosquilla oratoria TaxID=337810 RepID=UPI003F76FA42
MVLVKNNLPHRRVARPVHCGEGVEVMAVEFLLPDLPLLIYNTYRSPGMPLEVDEVLSLATHNNIIVDGDFNAHHPKLHSSSPTNPTGRQLATTLEEVQDISLLNTGEPTHVRRGRLDLTVVSTNLVSGNSWWVHPTLTSDHYAVITTLRAALPLPPLPPPRWHLRMAD